MKTYNKNGATIMISLMVMPNNSLILNTISGRTSHHMRDPRNISIFPILVVTRNMSLPIIALKGPGPIINLKKPTNIPLTRLRPVLAPNPIVLAYDLKLIITSVPIIAGTIIGNKKTAPMPNIGKSRLKDLLSISIFNKRQISMSQGII
jgi:hypothetical protein